MSRRSVLPLAARAAALAPWSVAVLDTYGAVLADLGSCREALSAQHRAVDLVDRPAEARGQGNGEPGEAVSARPGRRGPGRNEDLAGQVRTHLEEIEARCHPAQPPARG